MSDYLYNTSPEFLHRFVLENQAKEQAPDPLDAATGSARATIELGHTGDYPGYPCGWINARPLGDEQWRLLLSLFAVPGEGVGYERRRKLFEFLGAKNIPGSVETYPLAGVLRIEFQPNDSSAANP